MRVSQLINRNSNAAANQFVIEDGNKVIFQSYSTKICEIENGKITLDSNALYYSHTTRKHLYMFLDMDRKQIESGIKSGEIKVEQLN